jgi:hypothetical protein
MAITTTVAKVHATSLNARDYADVRATVVAALAQGTVARDLAEPDRAVRSAASGKCRALKSHSRRRRVSLT